jgi:transcriptional regulator with XRE-family HTH domain
MRYKRLPCELCAAGSWPRGPFTVGDDAGEQGAAATVGRLAAALGNRRRQLGWSQAFLAQRSGVGQHTVGRIEAGRTWPDLATTARLAHALDVHLTLGAGSTATTDVPVAVSAAAVTGGPAAAGVPVRLPLPRGASGAQVIDALLAHDPRLAAEVNALVTRRRRSPGDSNRSAR